MFADAAATAGICGRKADRAAASTAVGDLDLFVAFRDKPNALYRNSYDEDGDLDVITGNMDGDAKRSLRLAHSPDVWRPDLRAQAAARRKMIGPR